MAAAVQDTDRCAVCRRHFLQGEAIRLYREPSSRALQRVCPLCSQGATRRGWQLCEATREMPLQMHGDPARMERAVQRDRLVERLQGQLESVEEQLFRTRNSLEGAERRASDLDETRKELRQLDMALRESESERISLASEVERLTQALAQAQLRERRLERAEKRLRELESELDAAQSETRRVLGARRREADPRYLRGIAAEAFNRSPHASDVADVARALGEPRCRIAIDGARLPRRLLLIFAWERAWREYRVVVDLVERSVSVDPHGAGDDPDRVFSGGFRTNAAWTPSNGLIADP